MRDLVNSSDNIKYRVTAQTTSFAHEQEEPLDCGGMENPPDTQGLPREVTFSETGLPNFAITRPEVLILSNVLGMSRQEFNTGKEVDLNQTMALTVVDDTTPTIFFATSSQEEMAAQAATGAVLHDLQCHAESAGGINIP